MLTVDKALAKAERIVRRIIVDAERKLESDLLLDHAAALDPDSIDDALAAAHDHNERAIADLLERLQLELPAWLREAH